MMQVRSRMRVLLLVAMTASLMSWAHRVAAGQELASASRGPRFLRALSSGAQVEIDAGGSAVLRRLVSLDLAYPTVGTLLTAIERQAGLKFVFNLARLPANRSVELQAQKITVAAALTAILLDTGLDVLLSLGDHIVLVERVHTTVPAGTIVGLPLLAGGDIGDADARFKLHAELAILVDQGLTPLQALQAATLNPARALQATDSLGTVAAGKLADLVLLDANPLADITNTTMINAVVANGRYFDRAALDAVVAQIQAEVQ